MARTEKTVQDQATAETTVQDQTVTTPADRVSSEDIFSSAEHLIAFKSLVENIAMQYFREEYRTYIAAIPAPEPVADAV